MTTLAPMSADDFKVYERHALNDYSRDGCKGAWPSREEAQRQFKLAFPDGLQTAGFEFLAIRAGCTVGSLILKAIDRPSGHEAFIMDIVIESEHRRKGYATEALTALATWASDRNFSQISLSVMSSNKTARSLYEKAGFSPVFTRLAKVIQSEPGNR